MSEGQEEPSRTRKARRKRAARGGLHLYQRGPMWWVRGTVAGIDIRRSLETSSFEHAEHLKSKLEREILDEKVHGKAVIATFDDCLLRYLQFRKPVAMMYYLDKLRTYFKDWKVRDITDEALADYIAKYHPNAGGATKNTAVMVPMIAVLRFAARTKPKLCELPTLTRYTENSARVRAAPEEWISEFISKTGNVKLRALFLLCTTTGARCIDALRLRSENIDYENMTAVTERTKNTEVRVLPLIPHVVEALKAFDHQPDGRVFPYRKTNLVNTMVRHECERLGMAYYSTHKIGRHAYAERMLADRCTLKELKEGGGWKSMRAVEKYAHLEQSKVDELTRNAAAKLMRGGLKVVNGGKG